MGTCMFFLIWSFTLVSISKQAPSFVITAPKVIHLEVEENVAVQVQGVHGSITMTLYLENPGRGTQSQKCSDDAVVQLPASGGLYEKIVHLKITKLQAEQCQLFKQVREKYVHLVAVSSNNFPIRKVPIRWSSRRGYLFIQTDKPIYTPNERVQFRVFTLDHKMKPTEKAIMFQVFNSKDIQVMNKEKFSRNSIINEHLMIPDIAESGIWKIMAYFSDSPMSNVTTEFEVKKFVLPAFEVKIIPNKMYYSIKDPSFSFQITVLYTYGEAVNGAAYLRFGIIDQSGNTTFLKGLEQQVKVEDGKVDHIQLDSSSLEKKLSNKMNDLVGFQLYIAATVVDTASGEMEEAETKVKIVSSPYNIDLSRTKRFFSPGTPFHVVAIVTSPDGTQLPAVKVKLLVKMRGCKDEENVLSTNNDGLAEFPVNIPTSATELNVKLSVGEGTEIHSSEMVATLYKSDSKSYLYINVPQTVFKLTEPVRIALQDITPQGTKVDYFYYVVISNGEILRISKVARTSFTVIQLPVEETMIPSFRLLAYYYHGNEIVADSVWVDVIDRCTGKLELKPDKSLNYYEPGTSMSLNIYTSGAASVSLVAVDTAVYILNKKNKLTSSKVFAAMNSYDLGCTVGSGQNNLGVFSDAGLSLLSDTIQSDVREEYSCKSKSTRQKRSLELQTKMQGKVDEYPGKVRKCCTDGMLQLKMKLTCEQRAKRIKAIFTDCKKVLLECCKFAEKLRVDERKRRTQLPALARTFEDWADEQDFFDESSIVTRTVFPQSWLWKTVNVGNSGEYMYRGIQLPDSITTWEIQAVSMSKTKGICIAEPVTIKAFKKIHISLHLPYSVKRFEQLEVRAVMYNYHEEELKFTVTMKDAEGLCSSATSAKGNKQEVTVGPKSARAVYFSVVPMKVGDIPIHILAYNSTFEISDGILKTLRVIGEGVTRIVETSFHINPEYERSFTIDEDMPPNLVPESPSEMYVRVSGEMSEETVDNCLDPEKIDQFIRVPKGCAEQTMIYMSPAVSTIEYLDQSEQWIKMKPERKEEALKIMQMGYNRILEYRKEDGSYGAWKTHPSSTWLTAFVAKVLSRVTSYIDVDKTRVIHGAVNYLLKQQNEDGAFFDLAPVIHREMQGGLGGTDSKVSLTAFVIIALHHANKTYKASAEQKSLETSIEKAVGFLKWKLPHVEKVYTLAISAYALALIEPDSSETREASERLDKAAKYNAEKGTRYWEPDDSKRLKDESHTKLYLVPKSSAIGVEATSYALLRALLYKDIIYANSIVKWLTEQKNYGGGFHSTQDTVIGLEALAQYFVMITDADNTDLEVELSSPVRTIKKRITVTKAGRHIQEDLQFPLGTVINVQVQGKGKGRITIMRMYNAMDTDNSTCRDIKLEVTVKGEVKYSPDDYDYDYEEPMSDEPFSKISWFDRRNRRRREAAPPGSNDKAVIYDVCTWRDPKAKVSGMAIADITMLSGFEPNTADLDKLVSVEDQYISHYEFKQGKLLLYFDTIPLEKDCISFGAKQLLPIGLIQPTAASLYDFYEPGQKCTVFYNAPDRSTFVNTLCSEDACQCAEGPCPFERKTFAKDMSEEKRMLHACYSPIVEYGYTVKVLRATQYSSFEVYECQVAEALRATKDSEVKMGDIRYFLKRKSCKLQLSTGKHYLLMGYDGKTLDADGNWQYLLDSKTWIEEIPEKISEDRKCRGTAYRAACNELQNFLTKYQIDGCAV